MHSKKVQKLIWIFLGINIILLGIYVVLFYVISEKNKNTADIYSSLYKRASEKEKLSTTEKSLTDTIENRKILDSYFIQSANAVVFIEQVEKLGDQVHVDLKLNSVTPPKKIGDGFLLDFNTKGSFENIYRLFGVLDKLPFRVSVRKADLKESKSYEEKTTPTTPWTGSFTIVLESYLDK